MNGSTNAHTVAEGTLVTTLALPTQPGLVITGRDGRPIYAMRIGNMIVVNAAIVINGTYTGTSGWVQFFPDVDTLLRPGETAIPPWMTFVQPIGMELLSGKFLNIGNGATFNTSWVDTTIIYLIS